MKARSLSLPFCQEVPLPANIRIAPFFKKSRRLPSIAATCPFCKQRRSCPLLPLAVAVGCLHQGCGFPAVFAFDMFQACLASCQHKLFTVLVGLLIWLLCAPPTHPAPRPGQLLQDKWGRERSRGRQYDEELKPQLKARKDKSNGPTYLDDSRFMTCKILGLQIDCLDRDPWKR